MELILASTSPYRRALLARLGLSFTQVAPETDETPLANESPARLAGRLATAKAADVAVHHPGAMIIGSDQGAAIHGSVLHKPGTHAIATAQLRNCSGQRVDFHTGVSVISPNWDKPETLVVPFSAQFRPLKDETIERYLQRDTPYDCAGSFKVESLGIALFERLAGDDPTSLEGLPLIATTQLLEKSGLTII